MGADIALIAKKISVGILVTVIPLFLLFEAIVWTRATLGDRPSSSKNAERKVTHAAPVARPR